MLNHNGHVAEGTISNIFFVKDNILCTPATGVGILDGITRRIILDAARELGIKVKEGRFRPEDLYNADEVFISNTTIEVMPVSGVDDKKTPSKFTITRQLHKVYSKKVAEYIKG
ncbi:branched-chain-amino-acid aminotransferase [bacterium BMS3Abin09]|nr:branched-chain-amino-acid aminotransferase [bacterium BMS3Abin09]